MRQDAKKNLTKVAKAVLKDPLATGSEIASKTGLSEGSVSTKLKKLKDEGVIEKNDTIIRIAQTDLEHLEKIQSLEDMHIDEFLSKANTGGKFLSAGDLKQISSIGELKQKRHSLLMGSNTGENGEDKALVSDAQMEAAKALLGKHFS